MEPADVAYLKEQLERARLVLFTGAGFSFDCKDVDGLPLPLGDKLAEEIWELIYPGTAWDGSSLSDLFGAAERRKPTQLMALIGRRLCVASESVPEYMSLWYSAPWQRIYTLNIDDLDEVAGQKFDCPRAPVSISAVVSTSDIVSVSPSELAVIHLNGRLADKLSDLTFSAQDYARRVSDQEPWYAQLAADAFAYPFIFVGSPLEEPLFWQHLQLRGTRSREIAEHRPRSFIVTPSLPRAKADLLADYNVHWIPMTTGEFAEFLATAETSIQLGNKNLAESSRSGSDSTDNIRLVSEHLSRTKNGPSLYLRGAEPEWSDLVYDRAAMRECDGALFAQASVFVDDERSGPLILMVTGTAGTGKSTACMRLAMRLSAEGHDVGWVDRDTEVSVRSLSRLAHSTSPPAVLVIDDAERYGNALPRFLREVNGGERIGLLVIAMRQGRTTLLDSPMLSDVQVERFVVPTLQDSDIGRLVDLLDRENRLVRLHGMNRADQEKAFRDQAGRQLLVAMMQATHDKPFEEKVHEEWSELTAEQRYFYGLIALASTEKMPLARSTLLLARGTSTPDDLPAIAFLQQRGIVSAVGDAFRSRHGVIAEKLVERLQLERDYLKALCCDLAFAVSVEQSSRSSRRKRRFLRRFLHHEHLFRLLDAEGAEAVYVKVEQMMGDDHHYWLQRGSLHNQHADHVSAEIFLEQSFALAPHDSLVQTERAHMRLKKAIRTARATGALQLATETIEDLRRQNQERGHRDPYPVHILCIQGLRWARAAPIAPDEKRELLRGLRVDIRSACDRFPRKRMLRDVRDSVERELLGMSIS